MLFQVSAATLFFVVLSCRAQTTWNVDVGLNDTLTFNPSSLSGVSDGDIVLFQFVSKNLDSVVQSTFDAPCTSAGFGFAPTPNQTDAWSIQVLNASAPLWFFCSELTVNSTLTHCMDGMVFAINPTVEQSFEAFQQAAIATNLTSPVGENPNGRVAQGLTGLRNSVLLVLETPETTTTTSSLLPTSKSQTTTSGVTRFTSVTTATAGPTNTSSHSASQPKSSAIEAIIGSVFGVIVVMIIAGMLILLRMRQLGPRYREEGLKKGVPKDLDLAESEKGLDTRDGQHMLLQEPNNIMDPFQDPVSLSISPFETTSTLDAGPLANSYSFRSTITFVPTESSSLVKFSHTSPIRKKANIGGSDTEGVDVLEDIHHRDQQSSDNPDIRDNPEQPEPSQQIPVAGIPTADIPGQPGTGGLTVEEVALLRELRELQIVRRLEEIRDGRSPGAEHEPPPEYE